VDGEGHVLVEVKLWPRNDYEDVHEQIQSYRHEDTKALAVVMICDRFMEDWVDKYQTKCLATVESVTDITSPPENRVRVLRVAATPLPVTHFLLPVPRR